LIFTGVVAEPDDELEDAAGGVVTAPDPPEVLGGAVTTLDPPDVLGVVVEPAALDVVGAVDVAEAELESVAPLPPPPQPTRAATQATSEREANSGREVRNIVRRP
jgi:hypothetical protein